MPVVRGGSDRATSPDLEAVRCSDLRKGTSTMEQALTAHRQLRCILWVAEAAIISVCVVIAVQIGMEAKEAKIWACAPLLIIAVLETTRC
jgi:hypothetical protein